MDSYQWRERKDERRQHSHSKEVKEQEIERKGTGTRGVAIFEIPFGITHYLSTRIQNTKHLLKKNRIHPCRISILLLSLSHTHTSTHKDTSPRIHSYQSPCAAVGHTPPRSSPDFDPARIWVECVWTDKGGLCGWGGFYCILLAQGLALWQLSSNQRGDTRGSTLPETCVTFLQGLVYKERGSFFFF